MFDNIYAATLQWIKKMFDVIWKEKKVRCVLKNKLYKKKRFVRVSYVTHF